MAITHSDITAAADAILAEGFPLERVTNAAVRERLGTGSMGTIAPVMRAWRQERFAKQNPIPSEMPEPVRQAGEAALASLWQAGLRWVDNTVRERTTTQLASTREQERELIAETQRLEGENQALRDATSRAEKEESRLREDISQLRETMARASERDNQAEAQAERLREEVQSVREHSQNLEARLLDAEARAGTAREEAAELRGELRAFSRSK